jgi:hypothetical protein
VRELFLNSISTSSKLIQSMLTMAMNSLDAEKDLICVFGEDFGPSDLASFYLCQCRFVLIWVPELATASSLAADGVYKCGSYS